MIRASKRKHRAVLAVQVVAGLGLLSLAAPKLPGFVHNEAGLFTSAWVTFALLVVGSNLWFVLGVDRERSRAGAVRLRRTMGVQPVPSRAHGARRQYMR